MNELSLELLRTLFREDKVTWTIHTARRMIAKQITTADVERCILEGEIIEQYSDDYPYPSCLILGMDTGEAFIHVVVGSNLQQMWVVTAYRPSPDKWESDFKTRKKVQK